MRNTKYGKMFLVFALCAVILTSCLRDTAEISSSSGIGRENVPEKETNESAESAESSESESESNESDSESYTPPPLDKNDDESTTSEISWEMKDGIAVYSIPERDDSGLSTISEMNSFSTALFEDQGDDLTGSWYFGKTSYDLSTGEVTYVWDRSASTLAALDEYNGIYRGDESRKTCYITFDCGYEYGLTDDILDILKEKQVPSIFFMTGHYVKSETELIQRMLEEGHLIGNHTVNHTNLTQISAEKFVEEMEGLEELFFDKFPNAQPMIYMRPPQGACNEWVLKMADKMGYRTVMWSWAYYDYDPENQPEPSAALEKAKNGLHPGVIYLFHTESATNVAILPDLIDWIRSQGYEILPICDIK